MAFACTAALALAPGAGCERSQAPRTHESRAATPGTPTSALPPKRAAPPASPSNKAQLPAQLPFTLDQLRFHVSHNKLVASAGKRHAIVPSVHAATNVLGFEPAADGRKVTVRYEYEFGCMEPDRPLAAVLDLAPLAARMLNDEALAEHRAGRFAAAAKGFARAAELDPGLELARSNEACAWNRLGRPQDALRALAPLLRDNPVLAYSKIAADPDLQSLKDAPPVAALRASTPGDVQAETLANAGAPLVGLGGRAVAVLIREQSWGSDDYRLDLAVFAAASGDELLRTTLWDWSDNDHDRKQPPGHDEQVQQRYERAAKWLRELGFGADPRAASRRIEQLSDSGRLQRSPLRIKRSAAGASSPDAAAHYDVWKDGRVVGHFGANESMTSCTLAYLPSATALLVQWTTEDAEGCDDGTNVFAELLPMN